MDAAHRMKKKSDSAIDCPVQEIIGKYGMDEKSLMNIVRLNWRMSILSILASGGSEGVNYNRLYSMTGLNPRTLSIVLKELTSEKVLKRTVTNGSPPHVRYSLTKLGADVVRAPCPIFDMARKRNSG